MAAISSEEQRTALRQEQLGHGREQVHEAADRLTQQERRGRERQGQQHAVDKQVT